MHIVSVGEVLWDVFDRDRHIGGAPFNFSAHATRLGHDVSFVSAVGDDPLGRQTTEQIAGLGLSTRHIATTARAPTGTVRVFVDAGGQPTYTINRPAAYDFPQFTVNDMALLVDRGVDWIYFGTLAQLSPVVKRIVDALVGAFPRAQRLYDINLRKDSYTPELVDESLRNATVLKINDQEVEQVAALLREPTPQLEGFAREWSKRYGWRGVCVTRGDRGCALYLDGQYVEVPGVKVKVADAVGAGDAFAAALLHGIGQGWPIDRIGGFANRLGALVASRNGAIPPWTLQELQPNQV